MAVVEGRLQVRNWTDKEGNKRRSAEILADSIYFGASKKDDGAESDENETVDDDDPDLPF